MQLPQRWASCQISIPDVLQRRCSQAPAQAVKQEAAQRADHGPSLHRVVKRMHRAPISRPQQPTTPHQAAALTGLPSNPGLMQHPGVPGREPFAAAEVPRPPDQRPEDGVMRYNGEGPAQPPAATGLQHPYLVPHMTRPVQHVAGPAPGGYLEAAAGPLAVLKQEGLSCSAQQTAGQPLALVPHSGLSPCAAALQVRPYLPGGQAGFASRGVSLDLQQCGMRLSCCCCCAHMLQLCRSRSSRVREYTG